MLFNWSLGTDTQHQEAAARQMLRAGQLRRWASQTMSSRVASTLLALVFVTPPALGSDNFSLCSKSEINYSSCRIGTKIASFCLSGDVSEKGGYLQYRFGTKAKIELVYPERIGQRVPFLEGKDFSFSDGGIRYMAFVIGSYRYVYYETQIKGRPDKEGRVENGLAVMKNDITIKNQRCSAVSDGLSGPKSPSRLLDYPEGMFVEEAFTPW